MHKISGMLVALSLLVSLPAFAQGTPSADRPQLFVGDSWTYQFRNERYENSGTNNYTYAKTLTQIDANRLVFERQNVDKPNNKPVIEVADGSLNMISQTGSAAVTFTKPYPVLNFPLYVGKAWTEKYEGKWASGSTYHYDLSAVVADFGPITVVADTFMAFRVKVRLNYVGTKIGEAAWGSFAEQTYWYAPEAKAIVRSESLDRYSSYSQGASSGPVVRELARFKFASDPKPDATTVQR